MKKILFNKNLFLIIYCYIYDIKYDKRFEFIKTNKLYTKYYYDIYIYNIIKDYKIICIKLIYFELKNTINDCLECKDSKQLFPTENFIFELSNNIIIIPRKILIIKNFYIIGDCILK